MKLKSVSGLLPTLDHLGPVVQEILTKTHKNGKNTKNLRFGQSCISETMSQAEYQSLTISYKQIYAIHLSRVTKFFMNEISQPMVVVQLSKLFHTLEFNAGQHGKSIEFFEVLDTQLMACTQTITVAMVISMLGLIQIVKTEPVSP